MRYNNLIEISTYLETFEAEFQAESFSMEKFAFWLSEKVSSKPRSGNISSEKDENPIFEQSPDVQISILLGRMGKYARIYTKRIFQNKKLSGMDDFTFMATLMFHPSMTKSELIHHNLMDSITSGSDIIKRLVKNQYIEEFDDLNDKRSRRVRITDRGRMMMFATFQEMDTIANIITGNLGADEKLFLLAYLKNLDHFHEEIYINDRKMGLQEIAEKYIEE